MKGGKRRTGGEEGRTGRTFRIIRQALSFSRARSYSSQESELLGLLSPSSRPWSAATVERKLATGRASSDSTSREYKIRSRTVGMGLDGDARERCSPCGHARDTDGPSEWRESLNRQQTQSSVSASGVDASQASALGAMTARITLIERRNRANRRESALPSGRPERD